MRSVALGIAISLTPSSPSSSPSSSCHCFYNSFSFNKLLPFSSSSKISAHSKLDHPFLISSAHFPGLTFFNLSFMLSISCRWVMFLLSLIVYSLCVCLVGVIFFDYRVDWGKGRTWWDANPRPCPEKKTVFPSTETTPTCRLFSNFESYSCYEFFFFFDKCCCGDLEILLLAMTIEIHGQFTIAKLCSID